MCLSAINKGRDVFAWDLDDSNRDDGFKCQYCGDDLRLVLIKQIDRTDHFRHHPKSNCPNSISDDIEQLNIKKYFKMTFNCQIEQLVGDRIADIIIDGIVIKIIGKKNIKINEIIDNYVYFNNHGYKVLYLTTNHHIQIDNEDNNSGIRVPKKLIDLYRIMKTLVMFNDGKFYSVSFGKVFPLTENGYGRPLKTTKRVNINKLDTVGKLSLNLYERINEFNNKSAELEKTQSWAYFDLVEDIELIQKNLNEIAGDTTDSNAEFAKAEAKILGNFTSRRQNLSVKYLAETDEYDIAPW